MDIGKLYDRNVSKVVTTKKEIDKKTDNFLLIIIKNLII